MSEPMIFEECMDERGNVSVRISQEVTVLTREEAERALATFKRLEAENAKLRNDLDQWERLTANIELPEYPIAEFQPKDLERENAKLQNDADLLRAIWRQERTEKQCYMAENAKLRKLAKRMYAAFRRVFPDGHRLDFEQDMRELGVEVDG